MFDFDYWSQFFPFRNLCQGRPRYLGWSHCSWNHRFRRCYCRLQSKHCRHRLRILNLRHHRRYYWWFPRNQTIEGSLLSRLGPWNRRSRATVFQMVYRARGVEWCGWLQHPYWYGTNRCNMRSLSIEWGAASRLSFWYSASTWPKMSGKSLR